MARDVDLGKWHTHEGQTGYQRIRIGSSEEEKKERQETTLQMASRQGIANVYVRRVAQSSSTSPGFLVPLGRWLKRYSYIPRRGRAQSGNMGGTKQRAADLGQPHRRTSAKERGWILAEPIHIEANDDETIGNEHNNERGGDHYGIAAREKEQSDKQP